LLRTCTAATAAAHSAAVATAPVMAQTSLLPGLASAAGTGRRLLGSTVGGACRSRLIMRLRCCARHGRCQSLQRCGERAHLGRYRLPAGRNPHGEPLLTGGLLLGTATAGPAGL